MRRLRGKEGGMRMSSQAAIKSHKTQKPFRYDLEKTLIALERHLREYNDQVETPYKIKGGVKLLLTRIYTIFVTQWNWSNNQNTSHHYFSSDDKAYPVLYTCNASLATQIGVTKRTIINNLMLLQGEKEGQKKPPEVLKKGFGRRDTLYPLLLNPKLMVKIPPPKNAP
jgi:DNA-binding XRE family transcriptional regulator